MSVDISFMNSIKDLVEIKGMIDKANNICHDDPLIQRIEELDRKISRINESFQREDSIKKNHPESPVKIKRKREITKLLESHSRLTSTQLSLITGISRTRCNEYLRELEEQGLAKGIVNNKKKFYRLVRWEK